MQTTYWLSNHEIKNHALGTPSLLVFRLALLSSLVSRLSSLLYKRITHFRPICTVSSYLIYYLFHDLDKRYGKPNLLVVWCTSSLNSAHDKVTNHESIGHGS